VFIPIKLIFFKLKQQCNQQMNKIISESNKGHKENLGCVVRSSYV
jgi:hypothetical protein